MGNLTEKIEKKIYKGIYITADRQIYLQEMTDIMQNFQEKDCTVLVSNEENF